MNKEKDFRVIYDEDNSKWYLEKTADGDIVEILPVHLVDEFPNVFTCPCGNRKIICYSCGHLFNTTDENHKPKYEEDDVSVCDNCWKKIRGGIR